MSVVTRRMQSVQLRLYCLAEKGTLKARDVSSGHRRLIDAVKHTRDRGEEIRAEDLRVFEESKWVTGEEPDCTADSQDTQLIGPLTKRQFKHPFELAASGMQLTS